MAGAWEAQALVDVLEDDEGLGDGPAIVDEHGDLLVHGVGGQEELVLLLEVHLHVLVAQPLELQREQHPDQERARPRAQHLQLVARSGRRHGDGMGGPWIRLPAGQNQSS